MKYCPQCSQPLHSREIGGVERQACPAPSCGFVHWNNPIPVVAALVEYDGKVVLARNMEWPEGIVSVITGYLEGHELPEAGVVREVKEELGLDGEVQELIGCYGFTERNQVILAYWVKATGKIDPSREIAEVRLMSREELRAWDFGPLEITTRITAHWLDQLGERERSQ